MAPDYCVTATQAPESWFIRDALLESSLITDGCPERDALGLDLACRGRARARGW